MIILKMSLKKTLIDHIDKITWFSSLNELNESSITGVIISNELIDALPFHRLKITNGNLSEIYVSVKNDEFVEVIASPSNNKLVSYFNIADIHFQEDQEFEINLQTAGLLKRINRVLKKGLIVTIDYGYLKDELFNPDRMAGTYKCIYKHTVNESPFTHIGKQDITAHVDFSNLIRTGESLGINKVHYTTQGQFLIDWGILDIINSAITNKSKKNVSYEKDIQAIKNLILPELMGDKLKCCSRRKIWTAALRTSTPNHLLK